MTRASGWRHWARRLLPPALVDLVRPPAPPRVTWRGVYPSLREVPAHRGIYEAELIDEMMAITRAAREQQPAGQDPVLGHEPLGLVAGVIAATGQHLHVLDFGGGVGSGFVHLLAALPAGTSFTYLIVDTPAMCAAGRQVFHDEPRIQFATGLDAIDRVPHLVYVNSVLQYLDDYPGVLRSLASIGAGHLLLARLYAWRGPTFATAQVNLPGRTFANWCLNVDEVAGILAGSGYRVASDAVPEKRYQVDQPASHRAERLRTMLFVRDAAALTAS